MMAAMSDEPVVTMKAGETWIVVREVTLHVDGSETVHSESWRRNGQLTACVTMYDDHPLAAGKGRAYPRVDPRKGKSRISHRPAD